MGVCTFGTQVSLMPIKIRAAHPRKYSAPIVARGGMSYSVPAAPCVLAVLLDGPRTPFIAKDQIMVIFLALYSLQSFARYCPVVSTSLRQELESLFRKFRNCAACQSHRSVAERRPQTCGWRRQILGPPSRSSSPGVPGCPQVSGVPALQSSPSLGEWAVHLRQGRGARASHRWSGQSPEGRGRGQRVR